MYGRGTCQGLDGIYLKGLVTNYSEGGGYKTGRGGGHMKFKFLAMLKRGQGGGHNKFWGSFYAVSLKF